jgi:hypothetical protein
MERTNQILDFVTYVDRQDLLYTKSTIRGSEIEPPR